MKNEELLDNLCRLLTDNTVIDAGHYSPIIGPDETDAFIWELGVQLYGKSKEAKFKNVRLMLLVDDMHKLDGQLREQIDITLLPDKYALILKKYNVNCSEIIFVSQNNLRNSGWQFIRRHKEEILSSKIFSRIYVDNRGNITECALKTEKLVLPLIEKDREKNLPVVRCNLIVAKHIKRKQEKGFLNSINLYNVRNTENGWRIERGTIAAKALFGTRIRCHNFYFENKQLVGSKSEQKSKCQGQFL